MYSILLTHPEGDGGTDHLDLVLYPGLLCGGPLLGGQTGVVRFHGQVPHQPRQLVRRVVTLLLGQAVDDARLERGQLTLGWDKTMLKPESFHLHRNSSESSLQSPELPSLS